MFSDGPLSFSAPENSLVDHVLATRKTPNLLRQFTHLNRDWLPLQHLHRNWINSGKPWGCGVFQKRAFQRSEIGLLFRGENFHCFRIPWIIVTRSYEIEAKVFFWLLDYSWYTTREWLDRSNSNNTNPPAPWLKATFSGVLADESSYKAAERMAKTLDFNRSFIPKPELREWTKYWTELLEILEKNCIRRAPFLWGQQPG